MRRIVIFFFALAASAIFSPVTSALEMPKLQTFPFLDEEFRPLDERAFEIATEQAFERLLATMEPQDDTEAEATREKSLAELSAVLARLREGVSAKYGSQSREVQDMYRREASHYSLGEYREQAVESARKSVELARRSAAAYALLRPSDPTLSLYDQIVAYQDFISIAGLALDDGGPAELTEEAFIVAQLSELAKPALVANRRLLERELLPGATRDLALLAGEFMDQESVLANRATALVRTIERNLMAGPSATTDLQLEPRQDQVERRDNMLAQLAAKSDQLDAALFPQTLSLHEIQQLLQEDEAYVAFVSGESFTLHVFCVTRDKFVFKKLETTDWVENIDALRNEMGVPSARGATSLKNDAPANADQSRVLDLAWQLYSALFLDIAPLLEDKTRLLLSLHGKLMQFPFEMLLTRAPDGEMTFDSAPWLVKSHAVTVLPTVAILRDRLSVERGTALPRFLGVGNPDFGAEKDWEFSPRESRQIAELAPLPESASEVRRIGAVFDAAPDDLLLGPDATESRLEEISRSGQLAEYDVLLFATHGLQSLEMDAVVEASLAMTPTRDTTAARSAPDPTAFDLVTDGLLESREVERLRLDAELVILSACNSATDSKVELDGYSGLASAFMKAGANTIMVTHWPVISDAAVDITTRTIAHLDGRPSGGPLAYALRAALIEVIESGGAKAHPRYWAPFSLFGEP